MSFHAKHATAQKHYQTIVAERPDLADRAKLCHDHFLEAGFDKPMPHLLHAALRLLTEDTFAQAARHVSREDRTQIEQAEKRILEAVNHGPDFLKNDEDYLHAKGIMRGTSRYYLGCKGIELGGVYDRAWRAMGIAYRPIIADAVEACMKKDKVISRKVMQYVAVALMPEDNLKYLELNKLSMNNGKDHNAHLKQAASFIRDVAKKHKIEMSETMLNGLLGPKIASYEQPALLPLPPSITKKLPTIPQARLPRPLSSDFEKQPDVADSPSGPSLEDRLFALEQDGKISRRERKVYNYYHTEGPDGPRSISDVVAYLRKSSGFDKGENYVRLMLTNVDVKLRSEAAANDAVMSDRDRHQACTVRPQ